jgi:hypothetical protein
MTTADVEGFGETDSPLSISTSSTEVVGVPTPVSASDELPPVEDAMFTSAAFVPTSAGANVKHTSFDVPAGIATGVAVVTPNNAAFVPVIDVPSIVTSTADAFVIVAQTSLDVFASTEPKSTVSGWA